MSRLRPAVAGLLRDESGDFAWRLTGRCGLFQVTGNPRGFAAAIHHRPDPSLSSHDVAVDRIGKSSRKQTMRTEHDTVNTRIERQRIDIGVKRVEEVVAQSRLLAFIERVARLKVVLRQCENLNLHGLSGEFAPWLPTKTRMWLCLRCEVSCARPRLSDAMPATRTSPLARVSSTTRAQ